VKFFYGEEGGGRRSVLQLSGVGDDDGLGRRPALGALLLHRLDDLLALSDLAEDGVLSVEPRGLDGGDEELAAVGVGTRVGHGEEVGLGVLQGEVLISELRSVDALSTSSVTAGEVTALTHELGDDSVEFASLEVEVLAPLALALLTSAEGTEVLSALGGNVGEQLELDAAGSGAAYVDVEEDFGVGHGGMWWWQKKTTTRKEEKIEQQER